MDPNAFSVADLRDCPHFSQVVAESVWRAWWRSGGYPLASIENRVQENFGSKGIPFCIIAHRDGGFLGAASVIASDLSARPDYAPWVAAVWVEPEHRRQGIGGALVRRAADKALALEHNCVYLCARPENSRFYRNLGWSVLEENIGEDLLTIFTYSSNP
ncbi:MAG: GNAT family N-acetyltransferase [Methylocella sp.]